MKKTSTKGKATQVSKGCQKISSFFTKSQNTTNFKSNNTSSSKTPQNSTETIEVNSEDDDFREITRKKPTLFTTKRKFQATNEQKISPPLKKGPNLGTKSLESSEYASRKSPANLKLSKNKSLDELNEKQPINKHLNTNLSPVPSTSGVTKNCPLEINKIPNRLLEPDVNNIVPEPKPSLSETPIKHSPVIAVKSIEKLLSPIALRERITTEKLTFEDTQYDKKSPKIKNGLTPQKDSFLHFFTQLNQEKQNEKSPKKNKNALTPQKANFFTQETQIQNERSPQKTKNGLTPLKLNFLEPLSQETQTKLSQIEKNTKTTPKKNKIKKSSESSSGKSSGEKQTPSKNKKTPKKLFEKSPDKLNTFNVEVLKNFVKITPSKSNLKLEEEETSKRSQEIQLHNEKTPVKSVLVTQPLFDSQSPISKVRAKLDFSSCDKITENIQINTQDENARDPQCDTSNKKTEEHKNNDSSAQKDTTVNQELKNVEKSKNCFNKNAVLVSSIKCKSSPPLKQIEEKENFDLNSLGFEFEDNDGWDDQMFAQTDYTLDLTNSQHCKIAGLTQHQTEITLTLKSTKTNEQAICSVQGFWIHSNICIGDVVHVSAKKINENEWLVDNQNGCIVYEPDLLISATSVSGSIFCKRQSVFKEKFRGFEGTNKFMLVGSFIHDIFQEALRKKIRSASEIESLVKSLLASPQTIRRIYESEATVEYLEQEFSFYIPQIVDFVEKYVDSGKPNGLGSFGTTKLVKNKGDWQGTINEIADIEENIWSTELGVKGKIDVSVKSGLATLPLEVKTGRASCSLEHRAQVLFYVMMMNKLGYNVPYGLLLYIKEGVIKEITMNQAEKRDIILLRNELAYYLKQEPKLVTEGEVKKFKPSQLPEPIDHGFCNKCPYNVLCASYSRYTHEDISNKPKLKTLHNSLLDDLIGIKDSHIEYFMRWSGLLHLEMSSKRNEKQLMDIYTLTPNERKNKGKCLMNLRLSCVGSEENGMFETTFESRPETGEAVNFLTSGLQKNCYIVISVTSRPAVASGFVSDVQAQKISVSIDRNLSKKYKNDTFFLDTYESSTFLSYNLASLYLILDPSDGGQKLRNIIIDKEPPRFLDKLPKVIAEKGKGILRRLNRVQQRAVLKAIAAEDYMLIKGMPGTGKTATIVALIQLLVEMKKTILITSHTHSAVDNVCLKLVKLGVKLMRLGSELKIHQNLKECSEHYLTKDCKTPEELDMVYHRAQVLAVTCFGSGHPALTKRTLDICIVDESTQVLQCSVLRPLSVARTFILIGDPDQLPAVVKNVDAIEMGMSESLFERLNIDEARITLNLNYRMNEPITALANALTYNGELLIGTEMVAKTTLKIPNKQILHSLPKWLSTTLDQSLDKAIQFLDTGPVWNLSQQVDWTIQEGRDEELVDKQIVNVYEAAVVYHLVEALIEADVSPSLIGVIATYQLQVRQLSKILENTRVEVNTVDQYQGKDKSVIIYSCSKSQDMSKEYKTRNFELLNDKRRLNVAITRAKHKLIIVGDFLTLQKYSTFRKISSILEKNSIKLAECEDFDWDHVLKLSER